MKKIIFLLAFAGMLIGTGTVVQSCKKKCDLKETPGKTRLLYDNKGVCYLEDIIVNNPDICPECGGELGNCKPGCTCPDCGTVIIEDGKIYATFTINHINELMWVVNSDTVTKLLATLQLPTGQGHDILEKLDIIAIGLTDIALTTDNNAPALTSLQQLVSWSSLANTNPKMTVTMPIGGGMRPATTNVRISSTTDFMFRTGMLNHYWPLAPQSTSAYFAINSTTDTTLMYRFVPDTVHVRNIPYLDVIDQKAMNIQGKVYVLTNTTAQWLRASLPVLKKLKYSNWNHTCSMDDTNITNGAEYNQNNAQKQHKFQSATPLKLGTITGDIDLEIAHIAKAGLGITDQSQMATTYNYINFDNLSYTMNVTSPDDPTVFKGGPGNKTIVSVNSIGHAVMGTQCKNGDTYDCITIVPDGNFYLYLSPELVSLIENPQGLYSALNSLFRINFTNTSTIHLITPDTLTNWIEQGYWSSGKKVK